MPQKHFFDEGGVFVERSQSFDSKDEEEEDRLSMDCSVPTNEHHHESRTIQNNTRFQLGFHAMDFLFHPDSFKGPLYFKTSINVKFWLSCH